MITRDEILKKLKQRKEGLLARYPISELAVFGSYARNDFNENSDIDILVDFNAPIGIKYIALANELEDIFEKKIDLVSRKGIKPKYLSVIEKNLIHV
jgi:predicted nucleotidyltransferase